MTTTHYIPDTTPPIPYTIIHSARRTLGLEVRDGKVTVRVPDRLPEREPSVSWQSTRTGL